ncbi:hypothetical protein, partial [Cupriavidus sp. SK-4]|uniref:hypothetical protein n=1 Tax=Cupriavidus sp. SK-4 TaxID=574750 RepID=UPI001F37D877
KSHDFCIRKWGNGYRMREQTEASRKLTVSGETLAQAMVPRTIHQQIGSFECEEVTIQIPSNTRASAGVADFRACAGREGDIGVQAGGQLQAKPVIDSINLRMPPIP